MILIVDNYDSFTWNLVDLLRQGKEPVQVHRNDALTLAAVKEMAPKGILLSPGPGRPMESRLSVEIVQQMAGKVPILGICLGHQLLGEMNGLRLRHADAPVHGKTSAIKHDGLGLFRGIPQGIRVMRYHSLVLDHNDLPEGIAVTAQTSEGVIMGIRHKFLNFAGVQFHPESILTQFGDKMIENWLEEIG